ncbi:hypothetical protein LCGC14_1106700 [marine sediment metagenome]|uniref:Uncharacterized protein n=1 Tax=marine sediment metagenome TaxID=412755 RepID=A0A0F9MCL6_9ZZZZ
MLRLAKRMAVAIGLTLLEWGTDKKYQLTRQGLKRLN